MKLNKLKIAIICVILLILIVGLGLFAKDRIEFYQIKDKFMKSLYDLARTSNYQVIEKSPHLDYNRKFIVADGKKYIIDDNLKERIMVCDIHGDLSIIYEKDKKYYIVKNSQGSPYGIIENNELDFLKDYEFAKKLKIDSIKDGNYEGKDCYIIKMRIIYEESNIEETFYVDKETFIPMFVTQKGITFYITDEDENGKTTTESLICEYKIVEVGTAKPPEIDLTGYEEVILDNLF